MYAIDSKNKDGLIFIWKKKVCTKNIIKSGTVYVATNQGTQESKLCRGYCTNTQKENEKKLHKYWTHMEGIQ